MVVAARLAAVIKLVKWNVISGPAARSNLYS
jgi:hypothetical protein